MKITIEYDTDLKSAILKANGKPIAGSLEPKELKEISPWGDEYLNEFLRAAGESELERM